MDGGFAAQVDWVQAFGAVAVASMAGCYALEDKREGFTLGFAAACLASSAYAAVIEAWPFAGVELLWAGVAVRKWRGRRARTRTS